MGRDQLQDARENWKMQFQSTRPRGARLAVKPPADEGKRFNPRAHVGRDFKVFIKAFETVFQSTRPRGARLGVG